MTAAVPPALKRFIWDIQSMVELTEDAREILLIGADLMSRLIATDDWLPEPFAAPAAAGPRQFQLFGDAAQRFCVVSTVLAPGQSLPLLQEPYWQIMGVLRGTVALEKVRVSSGAAARAEGTSRMIGRGAVERLRAVPQEAMLLFNPSDAEAAIVIQVYGGEIGTRPRHVVTPDGTLEPCAFDYANGPETPAYDIWSIQTKIED